jgi:hypothetical protein
MEVHKVLGSGDKRRSPKSAIQRCHEATKAKDIAKVLPPTPCIIIVNL